MCGRYVSPDSAAIEAAWQLGRGGSSPFPRRFNVLPTSTIPVLRRARSEDGPSGAPFLVTARWGFIPGWWKQPKPPSHAFNARSEEAAGKPMWRDAWRRSRCLIPAEGWYEWSAAERTDPATGEIRAIRQPHYHYRADRRLVCFGGLLSWRSMADGGGQLTCALVTREASASVADVHDRMPVILEESAFGRWLDPALTDPQAVQALVQDAIQTEFRHHPVTPRLNAAKSDEEAFTLPA